VGVDAQLLLVSSTSATVLRRVWGVVVDVEGVCCSNFLGVGRSFGEVGLCSCVVNFRLEFVVMASWMVEFLLGRSVVSVFCLVCALFLSRSLFFSRVLVR